MEEHTAPENGDQVPPAAAPTPGTPQGVPGISPPGMKLRSGRKKRRRGSTDTSTDDEGEKPPSKPPSKRRVSSRREKATVTMGIPSDDETMTDAQETEDDETVEDGKPEAVNGHKPHVLPSVDETEETPEGTTATITETTAAAAPTNGTANAKPALEPISKLRMPSKHTPGKLQTTAPAAAAAAAGRVESRRLQFGMPTNVLNNPPPRKAEAVPTQDTSQAPQPPSPDGIPTAELAAILAEGTQAQENETVQEVAVSWYQSASTSLVSTAYSIREVAVTMIVPQTEQYVEGEEAKIELPMQSPILTRPHVWFIILLLVQLLFWPSVFTTVQETSDRSLHFYKSMLFATKEPTIDSSTIEESVPEKPPVEELDAVDKQHLKSLQIYTQLLEPLKMCTNLESQMDHAEKKLREIRGRMRERRVSLDDWLQGFKDVESSLTNLATAQDYEKVPQLFFRANEMLGFFTDMVPPDIHTELLDLQYVFLWQPSPSTCIKTDAPTSEDAMLTPEQLETGEKELRQLAHSSASKLMTDYELSSDLKSWIRDALRENESARSEQEATLLVGLSKEDVQILIEDVLEVEQADQTGIPDYASISAGAVVIRSGERATSPSLIDSLPLWNRLMKQAHLRFYGYGPEAALTPTWPTNALGQCWAFEKASQQNDAGRYATLTVRLGQPIHVTSVSVEHAPKELTDQLQSAIQEFRILGFEDANGTGEPWHLGSFRYDIGKL
jgi:hypothetical protein